ncbi:hypothetical protein ACEQ8H_001668 [Pleosporales sp. CAS-2024a]
MVMARGGLQVLDARIASTISWFGLESAILREQRPRQIYQEYCSSSSRVHEHLEGHVLESPLYPIRANKKILTNVPSASQAILADVLEDIHQLINVVLDDPNNTDLRATIISRLRRKLASRYDYPDLLSAQLAEGLPTSFLGQYRTVYLIRLLLCTAIDRSEPLSKAVKEVSIRGPAQHGTLLQNVGQPELVFWQSKSTTARDNIDGNSRSTKPQLRPDDQRMTNNSLIFEIDRFDSYSNYEDINKLNDVNYLLQYLKEELEKSDLADCWGDIAGILLWISLTAGAASCHSSDRLMRYFSALVVRISFKMGFDYPEAINATLLRMSDLINALNRRGQNAGARKFSYGKRYERTSG